MYLLEDSLLYSYQKYSKPCTLDIKVEISPILQFGSDKTWSEFLFPTEYHSLALGHETGPLYKSLFIVEL